jgi:hypothetical protein
LVIDQQLGFFLSPSGTCKTTCGDMQVAKKKAGACSVAQNSCRLAPWLGHVCTCTCHYSACRVVATAVVIGH